MIERRAGELVYFQFRLLAQYPQVVHGISGRRGDPARRPRGLNLSFFGAERPEEIVAARQEVCAALGLRLEELVAPRQVHGKRVAAVSLADRGRGAFERESALPETDALTTADAGVALFVSAADCVPLLFFDPVVGAIGAAHAGWRGTVAKIAAETVTAMGERYGSRPADLIVGIGPAIGPCCYAVGDEVVEAVAGAFGDTRGLVSPARDGRRHLDLWAANRTALLAAGVRPENIERADICTACRRDIFFSHRAEGGRAGRFGAIIAMRGDGSAG